MTNIPTNADETKVPVNQAESAKQDQGNKQGQSNQPAKPSESK